MPAPLLADGGTCTDCLVSTSSRWWLIVPVIAITLVLAVIRAWRARRAGTAREGDGGGDLTPPREGSPGRPSGSAGAR